ncbi:MAG: helix-turn-helix domain-containing protein [Anaerolineae bacterium]|nr:MAG: helix-turn-helix domain-containing protein [Anaerolineae bacterium]
MSPYERDAMSVNVGLRLRELRQSRKMSIRGLAQLSGLSANALSMIERGRTSPSVSTLYKLAEALGVPITDFFTPVPEQHEVVFMKSDERPHLPFLRGVWEGLGGEKFIGRVMPFLLTLESGASSGPGTMAHTGHEFVFCLRGHLEYQVEHDVYELEAGDSLLFAAQLRHRWRNAGGTVTNVLIVLSDFSEGDRPLAMHWMEARKGGGQETR